MTGLIPFTRSSLLNNFSDVNDLFNQFFNTSLMVPVQDSRLKCDIKELDDRFVLDVDLPGVKKEEIEVALDNGFLTIAVKKEEGKEDQDNDYRYIVKERRVEGCQRSFRVNERVTKDDIKAKFEDGVLTLTIDKKKEEPKDTKINVN